MLSTRWQPFSRDREDFSQLQEEMNRLWNSFACGEEGVSAGYPPLNIWEDDERLYVEAELPGLSLEDLEIYVTGGNQLTLQGERKKPTQERGVWHRLECGQGKFARTITLPVTVQAEQVEARLQQGVLTVTLPKSTESRPRKIAIKAE